MNKNDRLKFVIVTMYGLILFGSLLFGVYLTGKGLFCIQSAYHNLDSQRNILLITSKMTNVSAYDLQFQMSDVSLGGTEKSFADWYLFSWRLMMQGIKILAIGLFGFGFSFAILVHLLFNNEKAGIKTHKNRK